MLYFPANRLSAHENTAPDHCLACRPMATAAGGAIAGTPVYRPGTVAEILQAQHDLRGKLDARHGEYSTLTTLDQLNAGQRVDLFNAQDLVKTTLLASAGDRKICHRERKTGSNLIQVRCETVAEREKNAQDSRQFMEQQHARYKDSGGNQANVAPPVRCRSLRARKIVAARTAVPFRCAHGQQQEIVMMCRVSSLLASE